MQLKISQMAFPTFWLGLGILVILAAVAGVALGAALILRYERRALPPTPEVTQSARSTPSSPLSKFATDSAILKLREDITSLQKEITSMDYFEAQIAPPALDSNIKIE